MNKKIKKYNVLVKRITVENIYENKYVYIHDYYSCIICRSQ